MFDRLYKLFTSPKLAVVLLALGLILVFWGTIAQVHLGLYKAQHEFFRSFFIYWQPAGANWRIPIFPGGYLVGGLLLINLFSAHLRYYKPGFKKIGIAMIHLGVVLLLLGQLLTDLLSTESAMHLRNGESKNYSEADRHYEMALIDTTDAGSDKVVAIPEGLLHKGGDITHAELPFTLRVKKFFPNARLAVRNVEGFQEVPAANSTGTNLWWREMPLETEMEKRDVPSAVVELLTPQGTLGDVLVSALLDPFEFAHGGRNYQFAIRSTRYYKPFSVQLLEFRHDRYAGTDTPKNFSSRVRLQHAQTGENREVLIYMNNPLRYNGETYFQASFDKDDQGTVLQVVRNPGWLTPYFACVMVAAGMVWQFVSHLISFVRKQVPA